MFHMEVQSALMVNVLKYGNKFSIHTVPTDQAEPSSLWKEVRPLTH